MYSDKELIRQTLSGNNQSYKELIKRYQNKVFSVSLRFANNYSDAEDIAQEVFLQAFKSLETFRFDSNFSTWLYRITVNKGLDWQRKNKYLLKTDELKEDISLKSAINTFLEDSVIQKVQKEQLICLIAKLPETYKTIINLYYFDNLSYQDIAVKLKIAKKTVESRLYRGKQLLKEISIREGIL